MIQMTTNFSTEIMGTIKKWHNIFQGLKEKSSQNFISSQNTLHKWRWNKDILRWRKVKFAARRPALKRTAKVSSSEKGKWYQMATWNIKYEERTSLLCGMKVSLPSSFIFHRQYPLYLAFFFFRTEITNLVNHCLNTIQTTQDCFIVHTRTGRR